MTMAMTGIRSFLYKEDFNKFIKALGEAVDYVKTELMPDFNFDAYNHDEVHTEHDGAETAETTEATEAVATETEVGSRATSIGG